MRLTSHSAARIVIVGFLLASVFFSTADAYFCDDCGPGRAGTAASMTLPRDPLSPQVYLEDRDTSAQRHHSAGTCPVCLSPPLIASYHIPQFLAVTYCAFQDACLLIAGIAVPIYKPPRFAS